MSSTLLLRTLLITSALSGALVFACGEDTTSNTNNSNADDDDDGDDDDDDRPRDAGRDSGKTDARVGDGGRRNDSSAPGCTGLGQMCTDDDGNPGFQTCSGGQLGPCMVAMLGDAATVEQCPDGFTCTAIPIGNTALCTKGGLQSLTMLTCMAADECADLGLEGAACSMVPTIGGICRLPCTPGGGTPVSDAGNNGGDDDDAGEPTTSDAGGSPSGDAGRDSGSSTGSSDAGRDAGRDR